MPTIDEDYIARQHAHAFSLFDQANAETRKVEILWKAEFEVSDTATQASPSRPRIVRPARARAILDKFLTLLAVRADIHIEVIPRDGSADEQVRTSTQERWLRGLRRAHRFQTKRDLVRDFVYWYLLRGRGVLECGFDPSALRKSRVPIYQRAPDPLTVFPVRGENGLGYYTKETSRYVWEMRREIDAHPKWLSVKLPDESEHKENERVAVIEYSDDTYAAATVDGDLLYVNPHKYGFVPLAEAHCMDTPLEDMRWAYQSVLAPIKDSLEQMYALASKMAAGVDLFYWPTILVQFDDGTLKAYDGGTIKASEIPGFARSVTVIKPEPNAAVLQQLMGWYNGDVQLGGIPDIAWGAEPGNLQSGFAVSQVLAQIMDKIVDKKTNIETALGWHYSHVLRVVRQYGVADGAYLSVPAEGGDGPTSVSGY